MYIVVDVQELPIDPFILLLPSNGAHTDLGTHLALPSLIWLDS